MAMVLQLSKRKSVGFKDSRLNLWIQITPAIAPPLLSLLVGKSTGSFHDCF